MAVVETKVIRSDDLDGTVDETVETLEFLHEGKVFAIDLCEKNRAAYGEMIDRFMETKPSLVRNTSNTQKSAGSEGIDAADVREWAEKNGIEINERGRIPLVILNKYKKANNIK